MAVTCADDIALSLDAAIAVLDEPGHGAHVGVDGADWRTVDIATTRDRRGFFLASLQSKAGWRTTTTAATPYARKRLSDFAAATGWEEAQRYAAGDWWMHNTADAPDPLVSAGVNWSKGADGKLKANPHVFLDLWLYGAHDDPATALTVTWGTKWQLILRANGYAFLNEYDGAAWQERAYGQLINTTSTHAPVRVQISPLFRRCLYVFGSGGGELVWEDFGLDDTATDHTAPDAAAPLVPEGTLTLTPARRLIVQPTEVQFAATGTLRAYADLPYPPRVGATLAFDSFSADPLHWRDAPTGTTLTVEAKDGADVAWVADGTSDQLPLKVSLACTDRTRTPVFYAAGFRLDPTTLAKVTAPATVLDVTMPGLRYEVDEDSSRLAFTVMDNEALRGKHNRAVALDIGTGEDAEREFRGTVTNPEYQPNALDAVTLYAEDEKKQLAHRLLEGTEAYDGWKITDAIKSVLMYCGYVDADMAIQTSAAKLPNKGANHPGDNEPLVRPDRGTPALDFLDYLVDTYSSDWRFVRQPVAGTLKWVVGDSDWLALQSATDMTLYTSTAAAQAAGVDKRYVISNEHETNIEPEANDFLVVGQQPGGRPITAVWTDTVSIDPEVAEVDRPANWLGERRQFLLVDPSLSTQAAVDAALSYLVQRGAYARKRLTFTCEWHPQLRREARVTIGSDVWRVKRYAVSIETEDEFDGHKHRPCEYVVERTLP